MSNQPPAPVVLPPIRFTADGPSDEIRTANLEAVLPSPGYPTMALVMADAIVKRTDVLVWDFNAQNVEVRFQIDGLWHNMPTLDRQTGDYMLASLKRLANLDVQERRLRQQGFFVAEFVKTKFKCRIVAQGTKTGERVVVYFDRKRPPTENLEDCGMRPAVAEQARVLLGQAHGLFLVSCLPGDGMTTSWRATLQSCDRFVRDFFVIEETAHTEPDVINVNRVTYDRKLNEDPTSIIPRLLLRQPDVIALADMTNSVVLDTFCDLANREKKLILSRTHARSAIDAVMRMVALKGNIEKLATALLGIVCHRVLRKLCDKCKRGFQPSNALLEQLGLPPGRIAIMYQRYEPRPEELVDKNGKPIPYQPCSVCGGTGYVERTAVYELLIVNDAFREALRSHPSAEKLATVARQHGHITMRDEAIVLAARGITSLEEVQRVFNKQLSPMNSLLLIFSVVLGLGMVAAATWLVGLWNCVITWVNMMIAAMVASSFFEPLATRLNANAPESGYLVDFVSLWVLFVGTFVALRVATELLSRYRLKFDVWTEMIGRSIMAVLIAMTLFAFTSFTLHTAPLPITGFWGEHFQSAPEAPALGFGADRAWINFVQAASVGSFSENIESRLLLPYQLPTNTQVREFDPEDTFMARYRQRRRILSEQDNLQITIIHER